ncbi:RNA polymerase factor sigma-54 [[Anoxybacillus] calidus]|uniref:RNA polymerase factor sigma-54 n=1 Tax=[Anoxybacillus] calidus TaxID=575178 RepID=UPI0015EB5C56
MRAELLQQQQLKLSLTKELTQAIELLQYSTLELRSFLYEQSLENPFLEIRDNPRTERYKRLHKQEKKAMLENIGASSETLASYLSMQLSMAQLSPEQRRIMNYLIHSLDGDGYLRIGESEIASHLAVTVEAVQQAIRMLQSLEPAGVGARSLQECLYLQLVRLPNRNELAERIVSHHFSMFAEKAWKTLAKQLNVDIKDIQQVADLICTLQPRPGSHYARVESHFIAPDLIVERCDEGFCVLLNDEVFPQIIWNSSYEKKISREHDEQIEQFIKEKYQQFEWLVKSLEQRKQTLVNVMNKIVEKQAECFEKGFSALKPLTMREIAEALNIHESTVSRAVKNKFVQTPYGTVELRYFFSSAISLANASEDASAAQAKAFIKQLIEKENKSAPLSDQKLAELLYEKYKIVISRRTVAKYREQLNIPSSAKRKRY